jgi:hypothetical protein
MIDFWGNPVSHDYAKHGLCRGPYDSDPRLARYIIIIIHYIHDTSID